MGRQQRGIETRDKLYRAALDEFRRVGVEAAQIDAITHAAGTSRGTFYFHFPTKADVLLEVQRRRTEGIFERFGEGGRAPRSVKEFLERIVTAITREANRWDDPALMREILALSVKRPLADVREDPLARGVVAFFEAAADRGEVRTDISPEELARVFMTCIFGFLLRWTEDPTADESAPRAIVDVFLRGVSP